ncbi:MAG: radical SAM protein [Nitrososphaerota archaeon]
MFKLIEFTTIDGEEYIYNFVENRIYYKNPCMKRIIELCNKHELNEIIALLNPQFSKEYILYNYRIINKFENEKRFLERLKNEIFSNEKEYLPRITIETFEREISNVRQLTLEVSQACNLRCEYCIYSGTYKFHRTHSNKIMPFEIAQKSIDYFFSLVNSDKRTRPFGSVSIGFYGGEPLIAFGLIKECVEYIKKKDSKEKINFTITTNGTLLDKGKLNYLIENNFSIAISLDGPKEEHDKFRRFKNKKGSFDKIWNNIMMIKKMDKQFFEKNVGFVCIYCKAHNLLNMEKFFQENFPSNRLRVSEVRKYETSFFNDLEPISDFNKNFEVLNKKFISSLLYGTPASNFVKSLFSVSIFPLIKRDFKNLEEKLLENKIFKVSSNCFPGGYRIFVNAEGLFFICEKINQAFPIGDYIRGISFKKVKKVLELYYKNVERRCFFCEAQRFCSLCFAHHAKKIDFGYPEYCTDIKNTIPKILSTYVNVLLKNKEAFAEKSNAEIYNQ